MLKYIIVASLFCCPLLSYGQMNNVPGKCNCVFDSITGRTVYIFVDSMPEFPGGKDSLVKFIIDNVRYPNGVDCQGTVYISFVVEADGTLNDKRIVRGICGAYDEEAMRVINLMPKWKPGKCEGNEVPVRVVMPLKFSLY